MPQTESDTADLIGKIIDAGSVEAATKVLSDAGYKLTAIAAEPEDDAVTADDSTDEADEPPFKPKKGAKGKPAFAFLRDKMASKFK